MLAAVARALANLTFDLAMSSRVVHDGALPHLVRSYMHMHMHMHIHMHIMSCAHHVMLCMCM